MHTDDFSVRCHVCSGEVNKFTQSTNFIIIKDEVVQETETIYLSCGCLIDFPDWRIDTHTGLCKIANYANITYIEFYDKEVMFESGDDEF